MKVFRTRLALPSIAILAVILLSALAIGSGLWQLYLFYGALGVFGGANSSAAYGLVICRWFNRRRGLALSLMTIGLGAGSVCAPYLAQRLIAGFGWRAAFAVFGGAMLLVPLPIVGKFLKGSPQDMGLLPDGEDTDSIGPAGASEGLTWGKIWHSRMFWLMVVAFVLISAGIQGCTVHMAEIFSDRGASANAAALATFDVVAVGEAEARAAARSAAQSSTKATMIPAAIHSVAPRIRHPQR